MKQQQPPAEISQEQDISAKVINRADFKRKDNDSRQGGGPHIPSCRNLCRRNDHGTIIATTATAMIIVVEPANSALLATKSRTRSWGSRSTTWTNEVVTEYAAAAVLL